jgi:CRP-like cAMP-binding protein
MWWLPPVISSARDARFTALGANAYELAGIPLFDSLGEPELHELAAWFDVQNASEGVRLTGEGAAGYSFVILAEGSALVTTDGENLGTLGPGDFFREIAILGDGHRTATVTTTSPAKLLVMFGTEFRRLQQEQPNRRPHRAGDAGTRGRPADRRRAGRAIP